MNTRNTSIRLRVRTALRAGMLNWYLTLEGETQGSVEGSSTQTTKKSGGASSSW